MFLPVKLPERRPERPSLYALECRLRAAQLRRHRIRSRARQRRRIRGWLLSRLAAFAAQVSSLRDRTGAGRTRDSI